MWRGNTLTKHIKSKIRNKYRSCLTPVKHPRLLTGEGKPAYSGYHRKTSHHTQPATTGKGRIPSRFGKWSADPTCSNKYRERWQQIQVQKIGDRRALHTRAERLQERFRTCPPMTQKQVRKISKIHDDAPKEVTRMHFSVVETGTLLRINYIGSKVFIPVLLETGGLALLGFVWWWQRHFSSALNHLLWMTSHNSGIWEDKWLGNTNLPENIKLCVILFVTRVT